MHDDEMRAMLIEYMNKGFLENIMALFRQEPELCRFIPDLMGAEQIRVRLGTTALVEELAVYERDKLLVAVPGLAALLGHENATIRGDAASVLGMIRDRAAGEALRKALQDAHPGVRAAAKEALEEIG